MAMARAIRSPRGSGTSRTLQDGVEGLGQVVRPEEGPELPGGEEVGEGGATGGDGLGEGEEEVREVSLPLEDTPDRPGHSPQLQPLDLLSHHCNNITRTLISS